MQKMAARRVLPKIRGLIVKRQAQIHYIGGTDVLPPPLDAGREADCIRMLYQQKDPDAKVCLIEHNLRLVVYIAKKFDNTGIGVEDLISIGTIGLMKAVDTYNPEKQIKLATYASRCIENEILMYLRRTSKHKLEVSIDEPLNVDWDGNELLLSDILGTQEDVVEKGMEQEAERTLLKEALKNLNQREQYIIELRYGLKGKEPLTQKEVADELGISQSYISRIEKRIIRQLHKEMVKHEGL
ncbi:MAG: RNA polymerase sporulation sigma factor SigE [Lachnospiraceae bacterium]|nr:RNA polymerase sporulation sigma factor SigE [Lachnospiraceae bacterium]